MISGSPAPKVQCNIEQYFDASKLDDRVIEFIISPRYTGRMVFHNEDDERSETPGDCVPVSSLSLRKECMQEEY